MQENLLMKQGTLGSRQSIKGYIKPYSRPYIKPYSRPIRQTLAAGKAWNFEKLYCTKPKAKSQIGPSSWQCMQSYLKIVCAWIQVIKHPLDRIFEISNTHASVIFLQLFKISASIFLHCSANILQKIQKIKFILSTQMIMHAYTTHCC